MPLKGNRDFLGKFSFKDFRKFQTTRNYWVFIGWYRSRSHRTYDRITLYWNLNFWNLGNWLCHIRHLITCFWIGNVSHLYRLYRGSSTGSRPFPGDRDISGQSEFILPISRWSVPHSLSIIVQVPRPGGPTEYANTCSAILIPVP